MLHPDRVIQTDGKLILRIRSAALADEIIGPGARVSGRVWRRPQRADLVRHRVDEVEVVRNAVARERVTDKPARVIWVGARGKRVEDTDELAGRVEGVRKVTLQLFGRRDGEELCQAAAFSQPLVAEKPETFITPLIKTGDGDRPACSPAKLIEGVVRLGSAGAVIEPVVGVERVIAEELIEAAMKFVAAGLHDDVNYAAACAPELG